MKEPWEMTAQEWDAARERIRPCVAQSRFTKASGAQAVANIKELERLCYGVKSDARRTMLDAQRGELVLSASELESVHRALNTAVTHRDVIERALSLNQPVPAQVLAEHLVRGSQDG